MSAADRLATRGFLDSGAGSALEEAFDDAVTSAAYAWGHNGELPNVGCCEDALEGGRVELADGAPTSSTLARAQALEAIEHCQPGKVHAVAVLPDSAFRRRRLNLRFDDPALEVGSEPGPLTLTAALRASVLALMNAEGFALEDDEQVEQIELRRVRARYKPVPEAHAGRNRSQYVVTLRGDDEVLATGATAGAARREAVQLLKAGPVAGRELAELEVSVRARREDGSPLASVRRERVVQKGQLRVTLVREKNPAKRKVAEHVFYGLLPSPHGPADTQRAVSEELPAALSSGMWE